MVNSLFSKDGRVSFNSSSGNDNESNVITWGTIVNGTVSTTATDILVADVNRKAVLICNLSDTDKIYLNLGTTASLTSAIAIIQPNQTLSLSGGVDVSISAIASVGTINYSVRTGS